MRYHRVVTLPINYLFPIIYNHNLLFQKMKKKILPERGLPWDQAWSTCKHCTETWAQLLQSRAGADEYNLKHMLRGALGAYRAVIPARRNVAQTHTHTRGKGNKKSNLQNCYAAKNRSLVEMGDHTIKFHGKYIHYVYKCFVLSDGQVLIRLVSKGIRNLSPSCCPPCCCRRPSWAWPASRRSSSVTGSSVAHAPSW